jgi:LacI family transcriptional regulator
MEKTGSLHAGIAVNVTIKDVAQAAGVSPKTVSRVVNGEAYVRRAVKEAVLKVIDELGYKPNMAARSLAGHAPI